MKVRFDNATAVALYLLVAVVITLPGLGAAPLIKMEGMVADMSSAMLRSGDWVVPRLYGEIYNYKPPLVYWLTALAMQCGGRAEWVLRLPSALAVVVMGLSVLLFVGRATRPRVGLVAGLAAVTSMMIFSKTKLAEFDAVLACAVGVAVAAACHNLARARRPGALSVWLLCYAALAAGVLAKGAPALMAFGPGLVAAALVTGRGAELRAWRHLAGAVLFAVLVGAYLAVLWGAGGASVFGQPLAEAQQRGLQWTLGDAGRTLLKPLMIFVGFLPWSLAWGWRPAAEDRADEVARRLHRAGLAFLLTGTLIFMAVPTYEPRYFLPLGVPGAIVAALALERGAARSPLFGRLARGLATFCSVLLIAAGLTPLPVAGRGLVVLAGVAGLVVVWAVAPRWPRGQAAAALLVAGLCGWAAETFVLSPDRARARDVTPLVAELGARLPAGETIWAYGRPGDVGKLANVLFYYLDRPVRAFVDPARVPAAGGYVMASEAASDELRRRAPDLAARLEPVYEGAYRGHTLRFYRARPRD